MSAGDRLMVWQAQREFPHVVFGPMGSAVVHAIVKRMETPGRWVTAACGYSGFADETMAEDDLVCMRCVNRLRRTDRAALREERPDG